MFGLFKKNAYKKKAFFSLCPRFIFNLDPHKKMQKEYWKDQDGGDPHGYDKYETDRSRHVPKLCREIEARASKNESILELGCNCGCALSALKKLGYSKLTGVDICQNAIEYGRNKLDLAGVDLRTGSYAEVLRGLISEGRKFDLVYSGGANIILVHPSFDIVGHICRVSRKYVILLDEDDPGAPYPRLWEYEFNKNGFALVKFLRPADGGSFVPGKDDVSSIAVYQRASEV